MLIDSELVTSVPSLPQSGKPVTNVCVSDAASVISKLNIFVSPSFAVVGGLLKATVGAVFAGAHPVTSKVSPSWNVADGAYTFSVQVPQRVGANESVKLPLTPLNVVVRVAELADGAHHSIFPEEPPPPPGRPVALAQTVVPLANDSEAVEQSDANELMLIASVNVPLCDTPEV